MTSANPGKFSVAIGKLNQQLSSVCIVMCVQRSDIHCSSNWGSIAAW